jgi:hypothetical protein
MSYLLVTAKCPVHAMTSFLRVIQCLLLFPGKQQNSVSKFCKAITLFSFKGLQSIKLLLNLSILSHYVPNYDTTLSGKNYVKFKDKQDENGNERQTTKNKTKYCKCYL